MRVFAFCIAVGLCSACGPAAPPTVPGLGEPAGSSRSVNPTDVDPAAVMRVRADLPAGFEVADLTGRATPPALWGFGFAWSTEPTECGAFADPAGDGVARGFSASGAAGIIHVVISESPARSPAPYDPALTEPCATWTLSAGQTTGTVALVPGPAIGGVSTLGMSVDTTTVVEGGTETRSHADTFTAYLPGHVAYVAVVTDPGTAAAPMGSDVAAELLVEAVAAVRG